MLYRFVFSCFRSALPVLLAASALALGAQAAWATNPPSGTDSGNANAAPSTGVMRKTLKNGLRVIVVPSHLAPAVTTMINYNVGSREAPAGFPGMAHAQEHMMFRGTDNLSASQISAISAAMGGRFNADTQDEITQYFFTVPAQDIDVALHLHAARMKSVLDSEADWKKERGAIEQEVSRDLSSPGYVAYKKLLSQLFAGTPYAHDALGTKPSFDKTTGKMLKHFHDQWYAPNNATLVIAGDVDPSRVMQTVQSLFGSIPSKKLPARAAVQLSPVKPKTIRMATDSSYGLAYLAFRSPGTSTPRQYAAAQVLSSILSNPRGQLYSQLVATGKSLGTEFAVDSLRESGIAYAAAAFPAGGDSKALVKKMRSILAHIASHGVNADQVRAAKRQLMTADAADQDSIPGLARRWSQAVAIDQMASPAAQLKAIQNVSTADVNRLASTLLDPQHSVLTVLTPKSSGAASTGGGFGGSESFTPSHVPNNVKLPDWAAKPLATIATPKPTIQPKRTTLANGMTLITVPVASAHAIHVYGHIRNEPDLETPKGQDGVDSVLSQLLDFGTTRHSRVAYQAALDAIGAQASAGTDFSLTVLPQHFPRGLDLLAENELHPALPKRAFRIVREQTASAVAGTLASPDFHASQALKSALFPKNDPSLRHATPASVKQLTYKQVKTYYHKVFRPDLTTLVVVGNIDPAAARKAVEKSFGQWKAHGKKPNVTLPGVPDNKSASIHVPDSAKVQDEVKLAENIDLRPNKSDYRALKMGNQVLTGGFYASRLYRELRATRGLVYFIHSGLDTSRTRTHLVFDYGSDPDKVHEANHLIRQALIDMSKAPVSADELHRARAGLIRQIPLNESSADDIGAGLLNRVELDEPLDEPYRAARAYQSIGAKAIQAAFAKWVRPQDLVDVVQGPAPK